MLTFILSSGRTGTVFLHNVLSQLPGVNSRHERAFRFFRIIQNLKQQGLSNKLFDTLLTKFYNKSFTNLDENSLNLEINPAIKSHLQYFIEKFPEANFIHIVRDPRSHVRSGVNWVVGKPINRFLKLNLHYWAPQFPSYPLPEKNNQDKIFKIALQSWIDTHSILLDLKQKTSNYKLLKFEDLIHSPNIFLQNILRFSNFTFDENIDNVLRKNIFNASQNTSAKVFPSWQNWEDKYICYLHHQCNSLMNEFGYGHEEEWRDRVYKALKANNG